MSEKTVNAIIIVAVIFCSSCLWAAENALPKPISKAMRSVHLIAKQTAVRNLFMFNYTYYNDGFCKDQDCSEAKIETEKQIALAKMGHDFAKFRRYSKAYQSSISKLQSQLEKGDLGTLNGMRSSEQIIGAAVFTTCVDFAKVVLAKAIEYGFNPDDLKIYMLMQDEGFRKMCPQIGQKPILPRPVVHSLIAYKKRGIWFALNVEDPESVPIKLGTELPNRLSQTYLFTFPALIAYQKLLLAGSYKADDFINGYPFSWLIGITAAGKLESDLDKILCE